METTLNKFLTSIRFKEELEWDIKRYFVNRISSHFAVVDLQKVITEQRQKYDISNPAQEYGILGVNNQTGIFDAYTEKGSNIKQKYKRMEAGWIAYNPYRINVGSIGIKEEDNKNEFISPAYIVFSCKAELIPHFLYLTMKTDCFHQEICNSTTGSVRQNLSFENLRKLQIPLPSLFEQKEFVAIYNSKIHQADALEIQAKEAERRIEKYLYETLGIKQNNTNKENESNDFLQLVRLKDTIGWGVDRLTTADAPISKSKYDKGLRLKDICRIGSGGTPSRSYPEYYKGNIPWIKTGEVVNEVIFDTEEKISQEAIENSSAKLYPKGSLIIAMYGQGDTRGRTAKLGIDATTNQACAVLFDIDETVDVDYLWIYLQCNYHQLRSMASGNNQPNLNADKIKNYPVIIPPASVQKEIVAHVTAQKEIIKSKKSQASALRREALEEFEKAIFE